MNTYLSSIKLICVKMALLLVTFLAVAIVTKRTDMVNSLLFGGAGSYGYVFMLARNVHRAAGMSSSAAVRHIRAGLGLRLFFVALMAIIAFKLPGIKLLPFFIGLYTNQIVIRIDAIFGILKEWLGTKSNRRG